MSFSQYQPEEDFDMEDRPEQSQQQQQHTQPTITEAFLKHKKYDHDSHEAKKLDTAVTEFICKHTILLFTSNASNKGV